MHSILQIATLLNSCYFHSEMTHLGSERSINLTKSNEMQDYQILRIHLGLCDRRPALIRCTQLEHPKTV